MPDDLGAGAGSGSGRVCLGAFGGLVGEEERSGAEKGEEKETEREAEEDYGEVSVDVGGGQGGCWYLKAFERVTFRIVLNSCE